MSFPRVRFNGTLITSVRPRAWRDLSGWYLQCSAVITRSVTSIDKRHPNGRHRTIISLFNWCWWFPKLLGHCVGSWHMNVWIIKSMAFISYGQYSIQKMLKSSSTGSLPLWSMEIWFNSSQPGDAIWRHWNWLTLVQVMLWKRCSSNLQWSLVAWTWGQFSRKCS